MRTSTWWMALPVVVAVGAVAVIAWRFGALVAPVWTGEASRLAVVLGVAPGMQVADVGAGDGAVAGAMAALVGATGRVYATEISGDRVAGLTARKERHGLTNLEVVAARADDTGLPDGACDALYLRHVFHHLDDRRGMVDRLARAVRSGGRIAIIDFPPGALWFHGADHGVTADAARQVFDDAGWRLRERRDDWGGGSYLLVFERDRD